MCKVDLIQMQDFGILKDIFTEMKCHTANLSLLSIRSYITEYRKLLSRDLHRKSQPGSRTAVPPGTPEQPGLSLGRLPGLLPDSKACDWLLSAALGVSRRMSNRISREVCVI